jgi:nucleotide-binding universal stress UspA family protein
MLRKALIPISFREKREKLEALCALLWSLGTREVILLHVGSVSRGQGKQSQRRLESVAESVRAQGLTVETALRAGSVQMGVVETATERECDVIAFAFKKKSLLRRAIMGSTVKDVIRQSDIPIFVYKEQPPWRRSDETFRVMYATSLQWGDDIILSYIRDKWFQADEIIFVHVGRRAPDPFVENQRRDRVEEQMRELRKNCGLGESDSRQMAVLGSARRQIVKAARRIPADLVLLGKADSVIGLAPVLGSTTEEVSYNVGCSVLIVPRDVENSLGGKA